MGRAAGLVRDCRSWLREDQRSADHCRDLGVLGVEFGIPACECQPQRDACSAEKNNRVSGMFSQNHGSMMTPR